MPSTSTRAVRASALPPEERRASIVAAAAPLLLEHGADITSRQIAHAAGIAEGTIFRVFADKDEVIRATIESLIDPAAFEAELRKIDDDAGLEARLLAAVELMQDRVVKVWGVVSAVGPRFQDGARPMRESTALIDLLAPHAPELRIDVADAARRLRAMTMALTHPLITAEPVAATEIVTQFLHGAAAPGGPSCS